MMNQLRNRIHLLIGLGLCAIVGSTPAFTARDADTMTSAFNSEFYVQKGATGHFKNHQTGGISYFWTQAEMIESVIDAYEWTGDEVYLSMTTNLLNGFLVNNGSDWSWNIYNDDIMWAVLAFARVSQHTGNASYAAVAKANFDLCYARAWDTTFGGGLWWTTDNDYKNAAVNGPAAIAAYQMYQIYGDVGYLTKSGEIYDWEKATLLSASGSIADGYNTSGVVGGPTTYNQGTFIGAAHFLGHTNDAALVANFTMMRMTVAGILPEYGIADNNSGFNAIFLRWMTRFMNDRNLQDLYQPWLQWNAAAAWDVRRADNLSWCQWRQPSPTGINFYAWDCIASYSALAAADPTQLLSPAPFPNHPIGYWPLDETSGVVAADVSGNANDGAVNNGVWISDGRVNGCLSFDGLNSEVQVGNPLRNDFSIAFWVNTTQAASGSQWYHGAGLVDGDVPFNSDDFGTALVGGKFAFGVGNPDVTVPSLSSINDGNWHQCVATRQQATGTLKVYVDGILEATGTGTRNTLDASSQLLFGAISSGGHYFDGSLDEVRLFTRTVSSNEVAALYHSSAYAPTTAPSNLVATAGNARVRLEWSDAAGATSYLVERSLTTGGPYTLITNCSTTTFTDSTALNNRTYHYVVSGMNEVGEGQPSAQASASPTGLVAWFNADALTNLSNGAEVWKWPDWSGNGHDAIQTLSANRPGYISGGMNGQPVVRFNAAAGNHLWCYRPVQDDFTLIVVCQSSQGVGTGIEFYQGAGLLSGEVSGVVNDYGMSLNASGEVLAGVGNPDTSIHSSGGSNDGQPHIVTFKRTRSSGVLRLYLDGIQVAGGTAGTVSLTAPNILALGAQGVLNNFLGGDIAEIRIYDTSLSEIDRIYLERSLKCRYGLAGGAPPISPVGLTGAAGNRAVSLNWMLTTGAATYELWRSTDNGVSYQRVASGLTTSSYVDTTAISGLNNIYRVAAANDCGVGPQSAPVNIFLPLPTLSMTLRSSSVEIGWPGWANDWELRGTTNLVPPVIWAPVTNTVISTNDQFQLSLPMDSRQRFFILAAP